MGIAALEEKFQLFVRARSEALPQLGALARKISAMQKQMRRILDDITSSLCKACSTKCCTGMPIEGWFTAEDYFAYRMLYSVPRVISDSLADWRNCLFLQSAGCSLPRDMRPLACIKVNCEKLNAKLAERGSLRDFKELCEALDDVQTQLWEVVHAQTQR